MKKEERSSVDENGNETGPHIFRLYITGATPNSSRAIINLKEFFRKYFNNRYELQIIDVYQQPQIVKKLNILALPLLIRKFPLPERRFIGDMSNEEKLLKNLQPDQ